MSLLIGMLVASSEQLREYLRYVLFRKRKASIPPILHRAAFLMSFLLASGVFMADTWLHYTTSTIEIYQNLPPTQPYQAVGRGLSDFCLTFNRTTIGLPCSVEFDFVDPNFYFEQDEAIRLAHNTSTLSEIQITSAENIPNADVAFLIPRAQTVVPNTDYRATTIGVSTTCQLVNPSTCGMAVWGPENVYTNFSCTGMFHGTLGIQPNTSNADGFRSPDAYRSPLMYKPASNLMYSFFTDPHLQNVYNSVGWADNGQFNQSLLPWDDSQLVNPFYMGLAGRIPISSFANNSEMLKTNYTFHPPTYAFMDFILNCAVVSYDVTYDWVDGRLHSISAVHTSNGSVLEVYHGSLLYTSVSGQAGSYDIQDFFIQAPIAGNTTDSFLRRFGTLYSGKVLAFIGAYTTTRMALQQHQRVSMLLAKVSASALAVLLAWSLVYTVLGLIIASFAYRATRDNIRDILAKLSLLGLSEAAFAGQDSAKPTESSDVSKDDVFHTSSKETIRVGMGSSTELQTWI
jgi:hypothetical protein